MLSEAFSTESLYFFSLGSTRMVSFSNNVKSLSSDVSEVSPLAAIKALNRLKIYSKILVSDFSKNLLEVFRLYTFIPKKISIRFVVSVVVELLTLLS